MKKRSPLDITVGSTTQRPTKSHALIVFLKYDFGNILYYYIDFIVTLMNLLWWNIVPGSPETKTKLCPLVGSGILYMDHPKEHVFCWSAGLALLWLCEARFEICPLAKQRKGFYLLKVQGLHGFAHIMFVYAVMVFCKRRYICVISDNDTVDTVKINLHLSALRLLLQSVFTNSPFPLCWFIIIWKATCLSDIHWIQFSYMQLRGVGKYGKLPGHLWNTRPNTKWAPYPE